MAGEVNRRLNVAVLVSGPSKDEHDAQLHQALLIEKQLAKLANVTILDVVKRSSIGLKKALGILGDSFQVILTLTSNRSFRPDCQRNTLKHLSSLCRWNISGIDMWIEATKCSHEVYNALKSMDNGGFEHFDFLGPLKSAKRLDIQETALPSVYP